MSSTRKTEKKGKGKKKKDKADSEEAPAVSSVAHKRKAPTNTVSVGVHPLPIPERNLAYLRWKAGDSKRPCTAAAVTASSPKRIWEVDSEAEEEVLEMKTWENVLFCLISFSYLSICFSFHVLS